MPNVTDDDKDDETDVSDDCARQFYGVDKSECSSEPEGSLDSCQMSDVYVAQPTALSTKQLRE